MLVWVGIEGRTTCKGFRVAYYRHIYVGIREEMALRYGSKDSYYLLAIQIELSRVKEAAERQERLHAAEEQRAADECHKCALSPDSLREASDGCSILLCMPCCSLRLSK